MARTVTLLGVSYSLPEAGDSGYDQTQLSNYLVAIATAFPQLSGGAAALTAELDLGAAFGLRALYLRSGTANPATAGNLRLAKTDVIDWRNNANAANLALGIDTGDALTWGGANVTGNPMLSVSTSVQSLTTAVVTIIIFSTTDRDSDSSYSAGTGRYTIPVGKGGDYEISAAIAFTNAITGTPNVGIYKNAVAVRQFVENAPGAGKTIAVSGSINLAAGDVIDIRAIQSSGGNQALNGVATLNYFNLKRIPT